MRTMRERVSLVGLAVAMATLAGCRVDTEKHGDSENVRIETPFGGLHVKTDETAVMEGMGLPPYPGAEAVKKDSNNGSADVDVSFGSFQLRVKALGFRTTDAPDKVEAFYRNGLKRYGDVIQCVDSKPVGTPVKTAEGLTCEDDKHGRVTIPDDKAKGVKVEVAKNQIELKAGSKQHQHVVEVEPDGAGTKFGLVALDLPSQLTSEDGDKDKSE